MLCLSRCCEEWKECYSEITSTLAEHSDLTQLPDGAGIFTQIDAFMQRCRDLQDIADCQAQFARWLDGEKAPVPNIGQSMWRQNYLIETDRDPYFLTLTVFPMSNSL